MALTLPKTPGSRVFTHNPIAFTAREDSTFEFYRITLKAEVAWGAGTYESKAEWVEYPDVSSSNDASFNVQEIVKGLFDLSLPAYAWTDSALIYPKKFNLQIETVASSGSVVHTHSFGPYIAYYGGVTYQKWKKSQFFLDFLPLQTPWLTWQPNNQKVDAGYGMKTFLAFLKPGSSFTALMKVKMYFTDGTTSTINPTKNQSVSIDADRPCLVATGFDYLGLSSYETSTKKVSKYDVWLYQSGNISATPIGDVRTYYVDRNYYKQRKHFLWRNSLNSYDALLCTGVYINEFEFTGDEAIIYVPNDYGIGDSDPIQGQRIQFENKEQGIFTANTGWKTREEIDHFRDAMLSLQMVEDDGAQWLPIRIDRSTVRTLQTDQKLFALQFKYRYQFTNTVYTSSEYDNTLSTGATDAGAQPDEGL